MPETKTLTQVLEGMKEDKQGDLFAVDALRVYVQKRRPDTARQVERLIDDPGVSMLMAMAFAAGRSFERNGGSELYEFTIKP